jgi:hypothetical protein
MPDGAIIIAAAAPFAAPMGEGPMAVPRLHWNRRLNQAAELAGEIN